GLAPVRKFNLVIQQPGQKHQSDAKQEPPAEARQFVPEGRTYPQRNEPGKRNGQTAHQRHSMLVPLASSRVIEQPPGRRHAAQKTNAGKGPHERHKRYHNCRNDNACHCCYLPERLYGGLQCNSILSISLLVTSRSVVTHSKQAFSL